MWLDAWKLSSSMHHAFFLVPGTSAVGHLCLHNENVIMAILDAIQRLVKPVGSDDDENGEQDGEGENNEEEQEEEEENQQYSEDGEGLDEDEILKKL